MLTEIEQHRNTALREADGYANIIAPQTEGPGLILKGQNDALRDYLKTPFNDEIRHNHFTLGQCWATNEAMIMTHIGNAAGASLSREHNWHVAEPICPAPAEAELKRQTFEYVHRMKNHLESIRAHLQAQIQLGSPHSPGNRPAVGR